MIDDKKIEEEATNYAQDGYNNYDDNIQRIIEEAFKSGVKWMQEEFLRITYEGKTPVDSVVTYKK